MNFKHIFICKKRSQRLTLDTHSFSKHSVSTILRLTIVQLSFTRVNLSLTCFLNLTCGEFACVRKHASFSFCFPHHCFQCAVEVRLAVLDSLTEILTQISLKFIETH